MKRFFTWMVLSCFLFSPSRPLASEEKHFDSPAPLEAWDQRSLNAQDWFFSELPQHIANDLRESFWNRWQLLGLAGGSLAVGILYKQDSSIQKSFQPNRPLGSLFDKTMTYGFHPLLLGFGTLSALGISELYHDRKASVVSGTMFEALALTEVITLGLQFATQRKRPDGSNSLSFPSAHTSGAFALASVATAAYGPWVGLPSYALASLIGISRIDSNRHVASDVAAGALLGTLLGWGTAKFHGEKFKRIFLLPRISTSDSEPEQAGISMIKAF